MAHRLLSHPIGLQETDAKNVDDNNAVALNPSGSGWYPLAIGQFRKLATDNHGRKHTVHYGAWCVDQLLNEDESGVVGWSLEDLHESQLSEGVKRSLEGGGDVGRWVPIEELMQPASLDPMGFAVPNEHTWTEEWMGYSKAGLKWSPMLNLWVDKDGNHLKDPSDPSNKGVFSTIQEEDET